MLQLDSTIEVDDTTEEEDEDLENDGETKFHRKRMRIKFRINHVEVRFAVIDFGRCFLADSIAGGALRRVSTAGICVVLSSALDRFAGCNHGDDVCLDCAKDLMR